MVARILKSGLRVRCRYDLTAILVDEELVKGPKGKRRKSSICMWVKKQEARDFSYSTWRRIVWTGKDTFLPHFRLPKVEEQSTG